MLTRVFFYLFIKPMAIMPLPVLYPLSSFVYLVVYRILGYRKDVVRGNLDKSFPDKTEAERRAIERGFYHYFSDLMIETVWIFGLNEKRVRKRFIVENPELMDQFYEQKRNVILILGHYSFWEIVLSSLNLFVKHQCETIYIPLTNREFDRQFMKMRTMFNAVMIAKKDFKASFSLRKATRAIIFGADQSPSISKNIHWMTFLHQETAVAMGAETYAKKYDMPVVYAQLTPVKRGYFSLKFQLVEENPIDTAQGSITERHVRLLEEQIRASPQYWLWSHRRWKKKRD